MRIGYARVSTTDQNLDLQTDALKAAGCKKIFSDHGVSGAKSERPGLDKALEHVRKKDTLVIWKLDRLGRSLSHLLSIIEDLKRRGVHFASVQDGFDTSTASGKMVFSVIGAMADNWLRVFPAELICLKAFRYLPFQRSSQKCLSLINLAVGRRNHGSISIQARDSHSFDLRTV